MSAADNIDTKRVVDAVRDSSKALERHRKTYRDNIAQLVGQHYASGTDKANCALNFAQLATHVLKRFLTARNPRVFVRTKPRVLRPEAAAFERVLNELIEWIELKRTLQLAVDDAFVGMGVVKVGRELVIGSGGTAAEPGGIFADQVLFEDYVYDATAPTWREVAFEGNRYRVPLDAVLATDSYSKERRGELAKQRDHFRDTTIRGPRASQIGFGSGSANEAYTPMVPLIDVFLRHDGVLLTLVEDERMEADHRPLLVTEWRGPRHGPYHRLGFHDVPGNTMPLPPVSIWRPLHELANAVFQKSSDQARAGKHVIGVGGAAEQDAERIIQATDGSFIHLDHPELIKDLKFDGIDQTNVAFVIFCKQMFSWAVGGLDALGGMGPQADTATQEQMMHATASKLPDDMRDRLVEFTKGIVTDIAWYRWHDYETVDYVTKRLRGTSGIEVTARFDGRRRGTWADYQLGIEPYSMEHTSPGQRLRSLSAIMREFVFPILPLLQRQGVSINVPELLRTVARYADLEELDGVLQATEPLQQADMADGATAMKAPNTHRTYERINTPGRTIQGSDSVLMQSLLGAGVQQSEMEKVG